MVFQHREHGNVLILSTSDKRFDARSTTGFLDSVQRLIGAGTERLLLNLEGCQIIDSMGISTIVGLSKLMRSRSDVGICGARDAVLSTLVLTRLDKVFHLYPTESDALQALSSNFSSPLKDVP